jgi:tRNA pseudouridine38-40 synthase
MKGLMDNMKRNIRFIISYDGSRYYGWEHQPGTDMTIQGKLETVLEKMSGKPLKLIGAGRTDAGVHALAMVANVHLDTDMSEEEIRTYMNQYLPEDISVNEVIFASEKFHSRYNAVGKTYRYSCYAGPCKPVFDRKYVYVLEEKPDIAAMRRAANLLTGVHDFKSFCGNPRMKKSTVREIYSIDIHEDGDFIHLTYHGSGFLQYMVRILTGTLLEVGFGKKRPEDIPRILEEKNRPAAGFTAPAKGLCMVKVDYH